jgi:hypothetical protein
MSKQGKPQFVVAYGDRFYRAQTVAELDCDDEEIRAMFEQAKEIGKAVKLPDLGCKLMSVAHAGANIGDESHIHTHVHIHTVIGANIGDD